MIAKFASSLFLVNIIPGFVFRSSGIRTYNLSGEALLILVTLIWWMHSSSSMSIRKSSVFAEMTERPTSIRPIVRPRRMSTGDLPYVKTPFSKTKNLEEKLESTLGIWKPDKSGFRIVKACLVTDYFGFQMVFSIHISNYSCLPAIGSRSAPEEKEPQTPKSFKF